MELFLWLFDLISVGMKKENQKQRREFEKKVGFFFPYENLSFKTIKSPPNKRKNDLIVRI